MQTAPKSNEYPESQACHYKANANLVCVICAMLSWAPQLRPAMLLIEACLALISHGCPNACWLTEPSISTYGSASAFLVGITALKKPTFFQLAPHVHFCLVGTSFPILNRLLFFGHARLLFILVALFASIAAVNHYKRHYCVVFSLHLLH